MNLISALTSLLSLSSNGLHPRLQISYNRAPKLHTSLAVVNLPKCKAYKDIQM